MKTPEELNELQQQYKELTEKFRELTEEELAQVTGGLSSDYCDSDDTDESTALARAAVMEKDMPIM